MNPEIGHLMMGFEDLPYAPLVAVVRRPPRPHALEQPAPRQLRPGPERGVISPEQMEAGLYTLKMHGYSEYFGIDINPERMPVDVALKNSMDALRAANDRINALDHARIVEATTKPGANRGLLEAMLLRARAPHPDRLPPSTTRWRRIRSPPATRST